MMSEPNIEESALFPLSIITPVFQGERYISHCIENVLSEAPAGLEYLIIDGGSTDKTMEIVRGYAERHPNIRWLSEKDRGQSDAMNKGIALARGRYISFLNADDFYEPGTLKKAVALIEAGDGSGAPRFLLGNCRLLDAAGNLTAVNRPRSPNYLGILAGLRLDDLPVNPSAYFYPRALHDLVGLYKVEEHNHMDLEFLLRALPFIRVEYHDEAWGNFRVYEGTKTFTGHVNKVLKHNVAVIIQSFHARLRWPLRPIIRLLFRFFSTHFYARIAYSLREPRAALILALNKFPLGKKVAR